MLYRIFTEDKNRHDTGQLVNDHFDGFTIIACRGYWKNAVENTLIIEIYSDENSAGYRIGVLAKLIKVQNKQEGVIIEEIECKASLI